MDNITLYLDAANTKSYPGSGSTWFDLSGRKNDGAIQSGVTYNSSGYFAFNGTSGYVQCPLVTTRVASLTIQVVVNLTSNNLKGPFVANGTYYDQPSSTKAGYSIGVGSNDYDTLGNERLMLFPGTRWIDTNTSYGTGWKFVTVTFNSGSTPTIYDGITAIGSYSGLAPATPVNNTYIGRNIGDELNGIRAFGGWISWVAMYDAELTTAQIAQNYYAIRGRYGI